MNAQEQALQALQALHHQALLRRLREMWIHVEEEGSLRDQELLDLEVEVGLHEAALRVLQERLVVRSTDLGMSEEKLSSKRVEFDVIRKRNALLKDFEGFLQGKLFQGSSLGAVFFTQPLIDFAVQQRTGELVVRGLVQQSADGFSFVLDGKTYCFVHGAGEQYFFHPEAVDPLVFMASSR